MGKVLTPHASITRDGSLHSSVHNMTSKLFIFPILYFFIFLASTKGLSLLLFILRCDEKFRLKELRMSEFLIAPEAT